MLRVNFQIKKKKKKLDYAWSYLFWNVEKRNVTLLILQHCSIYFLVTLRCSKETQLTLLLCAISLFWLDDARL